MIFTLFIVALFGFAALSLDVGNVFREQRKLQVGTDAGALAGVFFLANASSAIGAARVVANTNGVTDAEIADGARNGYPGEIQVGQWSNRVFVANATPYNAVRVPARRTVLLNFGSVVGLGTMTPAVDSVAIIGRLVVQYGVPTDQFVNGVPSVGDTITLKRWTPGNWGPIDLCSTNNGEGETEAAISTADCFATIGESTTGNTGFDGVKEGFVDLCKKGQDVWMPVVAAFDNGNTTTTTIMTFIQVHLDCLTMSNKGGTEFEMQVTVVEVGLGASARRALVE